MTANMGDAECPICAEPFTEPRQVPCGHVYCVECLDKWVNLGDSQWPRLTCPTCREPVSYTHLTLPTIYSV